MEFVVFYFFFDSSLDVPYYIRSSMVCNSPKANFFLRIPLIRFGMRRTSPFHYMSIGLRQIFMLYDCFPACITRCLLGKSCT
jgi:hypothetical protein